MIDASGIRIRDGDARVVIRASSVSVSDGDEGEPETVIHPGFVMSSAGESSASMRADPRHATFSAGDAEGASATLAANRGVGRVRLGHDQARASMTAHETNGRVRLVTGLSEATTWVHDDDAGLSLSSGPDHARQLRATDAP